MESFVGKGGVQKYGSSGSSPVYEQHHQEQQYLPAPQYDRSSDASVNQQQQSYGSSGSIIYPLSYQEEQQQRLRQNSNAGGSSNTRYAPVYGVVTSGGKNPSASVRNKMLGGADTSKGKSQRKCCVLSYFYTLVFI